MIANNFKPHSNVLYLGNRTPEIVKYLYYTSKHTGWHYIEKINKKIHFTKTKFLQNI